MRRWWWWWWWRENNRNVVVVVVVVYSFNIHEAVLKKVECGVDVGSIGGRVFVDGKIYRINEEVEVEEGNKIENGEG